jgi:hypothetical protein
MGDDVSKAESDAKTRGFRRLGEPRLQTCRGATSPGDIDLRNSN